MADQPTLAAPILPKAPNAFVSSVRAELLSRKWRAMIVGLLGPVVGLIPHMDKAIAWIVVAATWTFTIAAYILGIAIEDNGTKRGVTGDTNITVAGGDRDSALPTVRTKRTSLTPMFGAGGAVDRVDTVETEVKGD